VHDAAAFVRRNPSAEFIASRADLPRLWTALLDAAKSHGGAIGYSALNTLRLEAGIPWFGYDFDDTMIPQEAAVEQTHLSFTKGCYTGQEIVERVRSRGHVNRRRAGSHSAAAKFPPRNSVTCRWSGSWTCDARCVSYALNRPIGFAYLRREHSESGTKLTWAAVTRK